MAEFFALCFCEVAGMEGSKEIINILAAATVIMPTSTEANVLLDFATTKHPKNGHWVQPAVEDKQHQPLIMDYLIVERGFRKK